MFTGDFELPDAYHMAGSPQVEEPQRGKVYRHPEHTGGMFPRHYGITFNINGPFLRAEVSTTREGIESLRDALNALLAVEDDEEDAA